mmetsp:Transcript_2105/g.4339  ORF Transcript_2105/g.4339 Transcript_2105/m.4339 type:complete len:220 (+) Transcript_2105:559-1218(+)
MSEARILSSKVARKTPLSPLTARLIWPRMPETVRREAPSNLATSRGEENMFLMKAVFLNTFCGSPTSLSFFTTLWRPTSTSVTTPVAATRNVATLFATVWKATKPVEGGVTGPQNCAKQCMCSGVYLIIRFRSSPATTVLRERRGRDWKRRQPMEKMRGSLFLRIFLCHRCFLIRTCMKPKFSSPAASPPTSTARRASKCRTNSHGTPVSRSRRYMPGW